jgi:hypothetical protein
VPSADGPPSERCFTLADLPALRRTLEKAGNVKLVVVDPIGSYLGGRLNSDKDNEVRSVLAPAAKLAEEYGAAMLVVAHTRKSSAAFADDTAMGSRAFTGLARSVLHVTADPDDPMQRRRLLLPGKCNLAEPAKGLGFSIGRASPWSRAASIQWDGREVTWTADDAVSYEPERKDGQKETERDEAAAWLRDALADGPMPAKEVREAAKEAEGIAPRTLDRAKQAVGVEAYRPENPGPWFWRLPAEGEQSATAPESEKGGALAFCPGAIENGDSEGEQSARTPERQLLEDVAVCSATPDNGRVRVRI